MDGLDKVRMDATAVLLSVMESGDVLQTKYRRHGGQKISLSVFADGNLRFLQKVIEKTENVSFI